MPYIDINKTYSLMQIQSEIPPVMQFFRNRYFPTGAEDLFDTNKVWAQLQEADLRMAKFTDRRSGDIPVDRRGYTIREYEPAYIAPSRVLTIDTLQKRQFGEAGIISNTLPVERQKMIYKSDLTELTRMLDRSMEWMCAQTMINNGCTIPVYFDDQNAAEDMTLFFYEGEANHTYEVDNKWDEEGNDFFGDVEQMCILLDEYGLPSADLVLGAKASAAVYHNAEVISRIKKDSGINTGELDPTLSVPGVVADGVLNFHGYKLNLITVREKYFDGTDMVPYFPEKSAMVTAPGCGHLMFGAVTQFMDEPSTEYETIKGMYVPRVSVDRIKEQRKLRLASNPLAAPKSLIHAPWIYAENVVN